MSYSVCFRTHDSILGCSVFDGVCISVSAPLNCIVLSLRLSEGPGSSPEEHSYTNVEFTRTVRVGMHGRFAGKRLIATSHSGKEKEKNTFLPMLLAKWGTKYACRFFGRVYTEMFRLPMRQDCVWPIGCKQ